MIDRSSSPRWIAEAGLGVALAVALPAAFHRIGLGAVFLPMHLPVLVTGAVSGPRAGFIVGALAPAISHLATGMPPVSPPIAPLMTIELAVYGLVAGIGRQWLMSRVAAPGSAAALGREYLWLLIAMIAGRLALGVAAVVVGPALGLKMAPTVYLQGALLSGLPGVAVQLVLIPLLLARLRPALRRIPDGGERRK